LISFVFRSKNSRYPTKMGVHASKPFKCSKQSEIERAEAGEQAARVASQKSLRDSIQA